MQILECGGNLYDAVSLAVKAALWDTKIPFVKSVTVDGNNIDMKVSEEFSDCQKLDVSTAPILVRSIKKKKNQLIKYNCQVTICKIGEQCIVDPNAAEEQCSVGAVVISVSNDKFSTAFQTGSGSIHPQTLLESFQIGRKVAQRLCEALNETLARIQNESDVGFLR